MWTTYTSIYVHIHTWLTNVSNAWYYQPWWQDSCEAHVEPVDLAHLALANVALLQYTGLPWWLQEPVYSHDIVNCRDQRAVCHPVGMFTQWNESLMEGGTSVTIEACQDSGRQAHLQACHDDIMVWTYLPYYWHFIRGLHLLLVDFRHKRSIKQSVWKYPSVSGTYIYKSGSYPWWRHQMETFSALLAICSGNSPVPGEFPAQMPVTRSFDVFFDLRMSKPSSKQSWGWWFEMLSRPLWRHRNAASCFQCACITRVI